MSLLEIMLESKSGLARDTARQMQKYIKEGSATIASGEGPYPYWASVTEKGRKLYSTEREFNDIVGTYNWFATRSWRKNT